MRGGAHVFVGAAVVGAGEEAAVARALLGGRHADRRVGEHEKLPAERRFGRTAGSGASAFSIERLFNDMLRNEFMRGPIINAADEALARLDNVVLSPHAICDTYELRADVLAAIARELAASAEGALPANCVNPLVVESAQFQAKRSRLMQAPQRT